MSALTCIGLTRRPSRPPHMEVARDSLVGAPALRRIHHAGYATSLPQLTRAGRGASSSASRQQSLGIPRRGLEDDLRVKCGFAFRSNNHERPAPSSPCRRRPKLTTKREQEKSRRRKQIGYNKSATQADWTRQPPCGFRHLVDMYRRGLAVAFSPRIKRGGDAMCGSGSSFISAPRREMMQDRPKDFVPPSAEQLLTLHEAAAALGCTIGSFSAR